MSLRKRGGVWWIDVIAPSGERVRRSTGTANKALVWSQSSRVIKFWVCRSMWRCDPDDAATMNQTRMRGLGTTFHRFVAWAASV